MKISDGLEIGGNGFMYILTATQTKEIFQIISLVLSILISLFIIIGKVVVWWKKSMSDGKITKEEIKELTNDVKEDVNEIRENVEDIVEVIENEEKEK